eukprot:GGOE01014852.1.p1 GENE.GGOE01014852.1~~GGOE01014852.1.p1  ORF type:complete len:511 (+),score=122.33 GGOE01014852.1:140-1534(+)
MVDEHRRQLFFHGLNVVEKGPPWLPDEAAFNATTSFARRDAEVLQQFGFNAIRLGVMWAGVEPAAPGLYDEAYLQRVVAIVRLAAEHGIHVLADMHQDVLAERFCGEGLPLWAARLANDTDSFPTPLTAPFPVGADGLPTPEACQFFSWPILYATHAVGQAFESLYGGPLLQHWTSFWQKVAGTLRPLGAAVLGYDLINEPFPGDVISQPALLTPCVADRVHLQRAYDTVAAAVRQADASHCIFFESVVWDNVCVGFDHVPGGSAWRNKSVFSFHFYEPPQFSMDLAFGLARHTANHLGCGSMLTEFDCGQAAREPQLQRTLDLCDVHLQSWLGWEYKPARHAKTGFGPSLWNANGTLNRRMVSLLSRTYAPVVAGVTRALHFDTTTKAFALHFAVSPDVALNETLIYLNEEFHYPTGFSVECHPANAVTHETGPNCVVVRHTGLHAGDLVSVRIAPIRMPSGR